ncbi:putative transcription factor Hap3/NF-YB family [Rosa chinensis]|uniref:Histone H2A n=1 Tax=Rosa chinensis TaxID=74649 RepID=A0A2P6QG36_ROSCH|nr:putative transcription factor Hap3/NF-YB family [Rosa chinensis]
MCHVGNPCDLALNQSVHNIGSYRLELHCFSNSITEQLPTHTLSQIRSVSRSSKTGLQFPVGRIAWFLKSCQYAERVGARALVYLSAVLEYLAAELKIGNLILGLRFVLIWFMNLRILVLELAGNTARDNKKNRIVLRCTISNQLWFLVEPPYILTDVICIQRLCWPFLSKLCIIKYQNLPFSILNITSFTLFFDELAIAQGM